MPLNPLQPFLASWQTRLAQAQKAGVNPEALRPVFQMDLQRLQSGSAPYTNEQAAQAVGAAAGNAPVQQTGPKKPDWSPLHLLGSAAKDIGTIGKGLITLPKTIAHDVTHIDEMPGAIAKGAGDIAKGDIGHGLQEIAAAPGLQEILLAGSFLIPGGEVADPAILGAEAATTGAEGAVATATKTAATAGLKGAFNKGAAGVLAAGTAGKALTPEGRVDISQHPLQAFLNVSPALHQMGVPGVASDALNKVPQIAAARAAAHDAVGKVMSEAGATLPYRETWRQFSDARKMAHNFNVETYDKVMAVFENRPPAEMQAITKILQKGDPAELAAAEAKFPGITEAKRWVDDWNIKTSKSGPYVRIPDPETGITEVFALTDVPVKAQALVGKFKDRLAGTTRDIQANTSRIADATARVRETTPIDIKAVQAQLKPLIEGEGRPDGNFGQASARLASGDVKGAARLIRSGSQDPAAHKLADQIDRLPETRAAHGKAQADLTNASKRHAALTEKMLDQQRLVKRAEDTFRRSMKSHPAARWHPDVNDEFHARLEQWAHAYYSGDPGQLKTAMDDIANRHYRGTFDNGERVMPEDVLKRYLNEATAQVGEWQKKGWNPSFVHTVTEAQARGLRYPQLIPREEPKISSYKEKMLNPGTSSDGANIAISLTHAQSEVFLNDMWHKVMNGYDTPQGHEKGWLERFGRSSDSLMEELRKRGVDGPTAKAQIESEWADPSRYGGGMPGMFGKDKVLIPKHLARNFDRLTPSMADYRKMHGFLDKGTRGYRFAVTGLSPQHMLHIFASGAVMMGAAMNDLPAVVSSIGEARRMIKAGEMPIRFAQEASLLPEEDAMLFGSLERSKARLYMDAVGKGVHPLERMNNAINRIDEHITQWYKTLDYVSQTKRGLDHERALAEVGKHFADHAGRSPLERTIFKSLVPFGSWTQHLLRYTFRYPADHPIRAGIIANLATAEFADNNSGLPRDFAQLFFLGHNAFDVRAFNPFRDLNRTLSLPGFISSLNPAAEAVFTSLGVNVLTGSAELYPELQVDPNTGKLVSKRKPYPQALAESAVPQIQGIEGLLGFSDQLRNLKKTDPSAYRYTLARYLHFPWLPRKMDIPTERAKESLNTFRVAQQAESNAMKTGDFGTADQFSKVPFQGQFLPPQVLEHLYALLASKNTGYTPNTLLRK